MTDDKTHLSRSERMHELLTAQFAPQKIVIEDHSELHAGHAGARPGGQTHYRLTLVSQTFEGLTRVARQRLIYHALREEFETGLHALSLDLKTPSEAGAG
ncbi:MAG TPA: BolA family protein [Candidatus Binatia bacterium]|nr:BolA family protein [Candidatus Binatia bacterium]